MYRPLHDGWTLRSDGGTPEVPGEIPAAVPGSVHTDLLAAGLIEDPYRDDNETRLGWIGRTDWVYTTTFDWHDDGHERADLVCEGLDTVATVLLNGQELGATANMHRTYRFAARELLREGENRLEVRFRAPYAYAEEQQTRHGERPGPYDQPYPFIRKMACNFGWDWGPTLVTSGIWRPIGLESWSGARLAEVRPLVRGDGVEVRVRVERTGDAPVTVTAEVAGVSVEAKLAQGESEAVLSLDVPHAERWWPRGHGAQPLYELTVRAGSDEWRREIGFRTVELETDAFRLIVNGKPVFVRGFNWIPDDCFPARVTPERLTERFRQAIGTGANALRVWGGGVYESEDFYTLADREGLLVWQDFPFACSAYPEEEPFRSEVEAEARDNVARLSGHPSLVLWCGNNEVIEGHQHWGWQEPLGDKSWGSAFYYDVLPSVVAELDPTRPYWPGSPYSGDPGRDARDPSTGTVHIWTVWGGDLGYQHYADYTPRFVAEFGYQGPPTYATLRAGSSDEPPTPGSSHQKAPDGQNKLLKGLRGHLPQPETFDDWHYYTQLNQARAMTFGVERFRALMPYCMGTIVWQLNDCWPVTSWAAVDGEGRRKPLWYALRRSYADRLITRLGTEVVLVNDTDEEWSGTLELAARDLSGEVLAGRGEQVTVPARGTSRFEPPQDARAKLLTAELGGERKVFALAEDPEMGYPPAKAVAFVERVADGYTVEVTAGTVLRDLAIFPDRLDPDATVDDQLVTLLPGERVTFHITTDKELDEGALTTYPVMRCVNGPDRFNG